MALLAPGVDWPTGLRKIRPSYRSLIHPSPGHTQIHTDAELVRSFDLLAERSESPALGLSLSLCRKLVCECRRTRRYRYTNTAADTRHTDTGTQPHGCKPVPQPPCLAVARFACSSRQRRAVSHSTLAFAAVSTRARNTQLATRRQQQQQVASSK